MSSLEIVPLTFDEACQFIDALHRHHDPPQGHMWSIGVATLDGELVGVATIGRTTAKAYLGTRTLEVTRTCTDGYPNANSCLYGAAWRGAKARGYLRLITYTQEGESGASLRAAGYRIVAERKARGSWDRPSRRRVSKNANVARTLWEAS